MFCAFVRVVHVRECVVGYKMVSLFYLEAGIPVNREGAKLFILERVPIDKIEP